MQIPSSITIPRSGPIKGEIRIPGSKSISNRVLLMASIASGKCHISGLLNSDDTRFMTQVLNQLGSNIVKKKDVHEISGCGGEFKKLNTELYIENAGTAARFLTAALTLGKGSYILNGNERMRKRPIRDLIEALNSMGGQVEDIDHTGCPPVMIQGKRLKGGLVKIPGDQSSQYISALLLTSPYSQGDTTIQIEGQLVSRGYVELTMRLMADFGVKSHWLERNSLLIPANQSYQSRDFEVEGDASSASYFLAMAAITGGEILIKGISKDTSQSDFGLIDILDEMGCEIAWEKEGVRLIGGKLKGIEVDMNSMSDVAQTLAVVALFAEGKTRIRNVANMRIKECDRISAMVAELGKLNAQVEEFPDGLSVQGMGNYHGASLKTYDDHRMAMSLSLAGLKIPSVKILDPSCVSKTFPEFFDYFLPLVQPLS